MTVDFSLRRPAFVYSILMALGMAVVIGSALGFQYIGGYIPCELCLMQRLPITTAFRWSSSAPSPPRSACRTGSAAPSCLQEVC